MSVFRKKTLECSLFWFLVTVLSILSAGYITTSNNSYEQFLNGKWHAIIKSKFVMQFFYKNLLPPFPVKVRQKADIT